MLGRLWWRAVSIPWSPAFLVIAAYRLNRALFLVFGTGWRVAHTLLAPLAFLARPWAAGGCELHYEADIGEGVRILHPSLGIVVSKYATIGRNCVLAGGNCIGGRKPLHPGELRIGDDVTLGAHAVVLGPIRIGNGATLAAGSVTVHDVADGQVVTGVPSVPISRRPISYALITGSGSAGGGSRPLSPLTEVRNRDREEAVVTDFG